MNKKKRHHIAYDKNGKEVAKCGAKGKNLLLTQHREIVTCLLCAKPKRGFVFDGEY